MGFAGIRRRTPTEQVALTDGAAPSGHDIDVDRDDAMLDAYNQMLAP